MELDDYDFRNFEMARVAHFDWFEPVRASLMGSHFRSLDAHILSAGRAPPHDLATFANVREKRKSLLTFLGAHPLGLTLCGGILKTLNWTKSDEEN